MGYTTLAFQIPKIEDTPPPKIIQSIPMVDATGILVWKNILDDGTVTFTTQSGSAYAGSTSGLLPYNDAPTVIQVSEAVPIIGIGQTAVGKIVLAVDINKNYTINIVSNYPPEIVETAVFIVENGIPKVDYSFQNVGGADVAAQTVIFKIQEN